MHSGQFCDVQELCFETAKSSDMGCATLLEGRFVDAPKSSFQGAKNSNMDINYGDKLFLRIRVFGVRNVQIGAVPSCKMFDLLMYRNPVFRVRNVQIWAVLSNN